MKKILAAVLFTVILSGATVSWAQGAPSSQPSWMQYKSVYTGEENDIANPHRTTDEITAWAQQAASDALSFSKEDHKSKMAGFKKYFVKTGWDLYYSYLQDAKILDMVEQQGYSVSTIVSAVPEIVNKGSSGGSYHWIMRMPITISFYKKDPATGESKPGPAQNFYLFIDVLRVGEAADADGIAITNWRVMDVPKN